MYTPEEVPLGRAETIHKSVDPGLWGSLQRQLRDKFAKSERPPDKKKSSPSNSWLNIRKEKELADWKQNEAQPQSQAIDEEVLLDDGPPNQSELQPEVARSDDDEEVDIAIACFGETLLWRRTSA